VPGIVLWAIFSVRTKDDTVQFFNSVAPVSSSTLDAATNAVMTTLITLVAGCSLIFAGAFILACARSAQTSGVKTKSCCPCCERAALRGAAGRSPFGPCMGRQGQPCRLRGAGAPQRCGHVWKGLATARLVQPMVSHTAARHHVV
jgi:hypothetical protein